MVRAKAPLVITFLLCVGCAPRHRVAIDLRVDGPTEGIREIGLDLIPEGDGPPLRARRTLGPADDLGAGVRVAVLADVPGS